METQKTISPTVIIKTSGVIDKTVIVQQMRSYKWLLKKLRLKQEKNG